MAPLRRSATQGRAGAWEHSSREHVDGQLQRITKIIYVVLLKTCAFIYVHWAIPNQPPGGLQAAYGGMLNNTEKYTAPTVVCDHGRPHAFGVIPLYGRILGALIGFSLSEVVFLVILVTLCWAGKRIRIMHISTAFC